MDKPDELFCYHCNNRLGWATDSAYVFSCSCGLKLRRSSTDSTVDAEPQFIDLVNKLEKKESELKIKLADLRIPISGGRGMPPAMVDPRDAAAYLPIAVILIFFLTCGILAFYFHYFLIGIACIGAGYLISRHCKKIVESKALKWEQVNRQYDSVISDLKSQIFRFYN